MACLAFGPYDCIPRNLIYGSTGWKVLDNEWTFPIPIPIDFLLWRGIYSLVLGLQPIIQAHTNGKAPVVLCQGYGRTRLYMPLAWYEAFELRAGSESVYGLGRYFARKVLKLEAVRRGRLRLSKQNKIHTSLPKGKSLLIRYEELIKRAAKFVQTIRPKAPC